MLKVDLYIVKKIQVFVVFDGYSAQFPRVFVIKSITLNNEITSYAIYFFKRTLQRFASKTLLYFWFPTSPFLSNICLLFKSFWIQNDGKRSTKIERIIQSAFQ